ncbi:DMT family transporter [Paenibacillus marinisediminis]
MSYVWLSIAIASEVFGSSMLKYTNGFTRFLPSIGVVIGYGLAFYSLSLALRSIPLSSAYAIWSGVGTLATAFIGFLLFKEQITWTGVLGILFIIGGVVLLNLSK